MRRQRPVDVDLLVYTSTAERWSARTMADSSRADIRPTPVTASDAAAPRRHGKAPGRGLVWIPGGEFWMGSSEFYPEEAPVHRVDVDGFWMDEHPVTVG